MSSSHQLHDDLAFVRNSIERQNSTLTPLPIAAIWAILVLTGFTLLDFNPQAGALVLMGGSPVAFAASAFLGRRAHWKLGEFDRAAGRTHLYHWGILFAALAALVLLAVDGRMSGETLGQCILIMIGVVYFLAGLHFSAALFRVLGLLMIAGSMALNYIDRGGWTTLGILIAAGLIASSFARATRAVNHEQV